MRLRAFSFLAAAVIFGGCTRCVVRKDERADLFTQPARFNSQTNTWTVLAEGRIYKPKTPATLRQGLLGARLLNLAGANINTRVFEERFSTLLAQNQQNRRVKLDLPDAKRPLDAKKTDQNGWFSQEIQVPASALGPPDPDGFAHYRTASCGGEAPVGAVQLLAPGGTSVISTVEDTIQATHADSEMAAVANVLFREYQPVYGMPERYRRWKQTQGVAFHYVSNIPRELYPSITRFLTNAGYPKGSVTLQSWHLEGASMLDKVENAATMFENAGSQSAALTQLIEHFPDRQFVLVGNTSLRDPETFADIARRYPERVRAIYLRLTKPATDTKRLEEAFQGLPSTLWHPFEDPRDLPDSLPIAKS